jgi:hypothetical protein
MQTIKLNLSHFIKVGLAILMIVTLPISSYANSLKVKVFSGGKPATGAFVCLGTKQERALFGLQVVDKDGEFIFETIPEGRVLITANTGVLGKEVSVLNNINTQTVFIALPDDATGPTCPEIEPHLLQGATR